LSAVGRLFCRYNFNVPIQEFLLRRKHLEIFQILTREINATEVGIPADAIDAECARQCLAYVDCRSFTLLDTKTNNKCALYVNKSGGTCKHEKQALVFS